MPAIVVVGAQWGDEGKGKIVDMLAQEANFVVRYAGGDNAGHTVVNSYGLSRLHLIPAGIFYPECTCIIGNGVVMNPEALLEEMESLHKAKVSTDQLFISERAHLVMPYHLLLDKLEEKAKGSNAIGTTQKGIGPTYVDKAARLGIRAGDLLDNESLYSRLETVLEQKNAVLTALYGAPAFSVDEVYQRLLRSAEKLVPHICSTEKLIRKGLEEGKVVLLEGAQGTLLDLDLGTYPYVTSSQPAAGGACNGAGLSPRDISGVLGIYKAYTTRVGEGPLPTELKDKIGETIRAQGEEYGATTGRPRRCGWFDGVAARYSSQVNGMTAAALTRLDVLDSFLSIKICTGYQLEDVRIDEFPASLERLARCTPILEELPGWQKPTSSIRRFKDLPKEAQSYVNRVEEIIGCPVKIVSVGQRREDTIIREPVW